MLENLQQLPDFQKCISQAKTRASVPSHGPGRSHLTGRRRQIIRPGRRDGMIFHDDPMGTKAADRHMDSYGYMIWKYDMCLELYTYIWAFATYKCAGTCSERERESKPQKDGKVFQGCCRQYVPIIFRFPTLLSILGLLYYVYIYIYPLVI